MKILIVEDDAGIRESIKAGLISESHVVEVAPDGAEGSYLARSYDYDAILLDYSLPKKDGLAVCREIRAAHKTTPIIFMSVTGDTDTKVAALEAGADDYLTKPVALKELSARLRAVARRPVKIEDPVLNVSDISLDPVKNIATRGGNMIQLTRKEFGLLEFLMRKAGSVVSRTQLMEHVWTADNDLLSNTIEAHIRNLRKKLNEGDRVNLIVNVSGRGYMMDTEENIAKRG